MKIYIYFLITLCLGVSSFAQGIGESYVSRPAKFVSANKSAEVGQMSYIMDAEGVTGNIASSNGRYEVYWIKSNNPVTFTFDMVQPSKIKAFVYYASWGFNEAPRNVELTFYNGRINLGTEKLIFPELYTSRQVATLSKSYSNVTRVLFKVIDDYNLSTVDRTSLSEVAFGDYLIDQPTLSFQSTFCAAQGKAKISNFNPLFTYSFSPAGPQVTASGDIINFGVGVTYKVTAKKGTESSQASNAFTLDDNCANCTKPATGGTPDGFSSVGITTQSKQENWPHTIPNGFLALESSEKGLVISRVQNSTKIVEPKEGMIIYDIDAKCVKLYNGAAWNCIKNTCGTSKLTPRNVRIGHYAGYSIGDIQHQTFKNQLLNKANYGPTGKFKGVTGFDFTSISTQNIDNLDLINQFDIIVIGYADITASNVQKIKQFADQGGAVMVLLDMNLNTGLHQAFGGTGTVKNGKAYAKTNNNALNVGLFGDSRNVNLVGMQTMARVTDIPSDAILLGTETITTNNPAAWITGSKQNVFFVWDEGIFRHRSVAGVVIDTPQEIFIHNMMAYILQRAGFQPNVPLQ